MSTTPGRKTHVFLDPPSQVCLEPVMAMQRSAEEMGRTVSGEFDGLTQIPNCGWQLEPLQRDPGQIHQIAAIQGSIMGPGQGTVPTGWIQLPRFAQLTETGIDYGSQTASTGDLFLGETG